MTTPNDIIKRCLKKAGVLGVGQTPSSEDMNDAFDDLNDMLGQWSRKRWLVYHLLDVPVVGTGAEFYSIGPGGDINTPRIDSIEAAYVRLTTQAPPYQVDVPMTVINSYEEWATVAIKEQPGFPQAVFLDSGYPLGTLYIWPVPSSAYEVHIILKAALTAFDSISQNVQLPAEYGEAIVYNLAGRLRPSYGLPPDPTVSALAKASLNTVRNSNAQIPALQMPAAVSGPGRFNIYTGWSN